MDNPPAFPSDAPGMNNPYGRGMSLRDWFAGQTLASIAGCIATAVADGTVTPESAPKLAATLAYDLASAMLAERAQQEARLAAMGGRSDG